MPLYLTWECCKCKRSSRDSQSLWSINRNHKYNYSRIVCEHFRIYIDTVSKIGFFGIGWKNSVTVEVYYQNYYSPKIVIEDTFCKDHTEAENYVQFDNVVFHARVSDYSGNYPTKGYNLQNNI